MFSTTNVRDRFTLEIPMEKGLKPPEKVHVVPTPELFLWKVLWNQAPHA